MQKSFNRNLQQNDQTLIISCNKDPTKLVIYIHEDVIYAYVNINSIFYKFKYLPTDENSFIFQIENSPHFEYTQLVITNYGKIYLVGNKQNTNAKIKTLELITNSSTCGWAPQKNSIKSYPKFNIPNIYNKNIEKINLGEITSEQLENLKKSLKIMENIKKKYFGKGDFNGTMSMFIYTIDEIIENTLPVINSLEFLDNIDNIILSIEIRDYRLFFTSEIISDTPVISENNKILKLKNEEKRYKTNRS